MVSWSENFRICFCAKFWIIVGIVFIIISIIANIVTTGFVFPALIFAILLGLLRAVIRLFLLDVLISLIFATIYTLIDRHRDNKHKATHPPEYASDDEAKEMFINTMEQCPELIETMKAAKLNGDTEWINRYLEDEESIDILKDELERYSDAIFDTEDVVKYMRWYYREKV